MNFLSHYYFDRNTTDCFHILGTVMPDLLKNADKTVVLHPEKLTHPNANISGIIGGWQKHLAVDRFFHSSEFFQHHSHQLKLDLLPVLINSPVKPFFLGHVALELILDNLLITTHQITVDGFYNHLENCPDEAIVDFLTFCGMQNPQVFIRFYTNFKKHRYLHTYSDVSQVAYALKRICMRIWNTPFTPEQEDILAEIIMTYRAKLKSDFMSIFNQISASLAS